MTTKFKDSIINCFISTGCAQSNNGTFVKYNANSQKGSLPIVPTGTVAKDEFLKDANYIDLVNYIDRDDDTESDEEE
jgi:hypothetical protein